MQRVLDLAKLQHRQIEQLLDRRRGERVVLLGRQRRQAMTGLGGNNDASTPFGDHLAELLQDERSAVEIDLEDGLWRRLRR